jgi:hypothetical protein
VEGLFVLFMILLNRVIKFIVIGVGIRGEELGSCIDCMICMLGVILKDLVFVGFGVCKSGVWRVFGSEMDDNHYLELGVVGATFIIPLSQLIARKFILSSKFLYPNF